MSKSLGMSEKKILLEVAGRRAKKKVLP